VTPRQQMKGLITFVKKLSGRRMFLWPAIAIIAFAVGRSVSARSVDFIVYHRAAQNLLAGRTDLYSATFAWGPPMNYVYPPPALFFLAPFGEGSFANAFGVWFALTALATLVVLGAAFALWPPRSRAKYAWFLVALAGPYMVIVLRYGNAHMFVILLVIYAVVMWARERQWACAIALALAGVVKVFPLFLGAVFLLRREWKLTARLAVASCLLWASPILFFGPRTTISMYRSWYNTVVRDLPGYERRRALDESISGSVERWLRPTNYAENRDRNYPEVNFAELPAGAVHYIALLLGLGILAPSLWVCLKLQRAEARAPASQSLSLSRETLIALTASVYVTAQALLGPYTPLPYFLGWLLVAVALPSILPRRSRLGTALLVVATLNLVLFAIPGAASQRAFQAGGAFTLVALCLWALVTGAAWIVSSGRFAVARDAAPHGAKVNA
jgi:Glycosyltransferase family 87